MDGAPRPDVVRARRRPGGASVVLSARFDGAELASVEETARLYGYSISEYVRRAALRDLPNAVTAGEARKVRVSVNHG